VNQERLDRALLFARAAVGLDESPATRSSLLTVLQRTPAAIGVVDHGAAIYGAAISPDGKLMAIGDDRGEVLVYDAATRLPVGRPYRIQGGFIQNVAFSPDGDSLAVSFIHQSDPQGNGMVDLIDPRSGEQRRRVRLPWLRGAAPFVFADVGFLPNGRDLLVRQVNGAAPDGPPSRMYRVDGETGALTGRLQVGRYASDFNASATADRRRVFVTSLRDGRTWELDPERLRVVRSWPVGDVAGAVSPDGRVFALGSGTGRLRLLDLRSGQVRRLKGGHDGRVSRMRFTPDGRTLVTTSQRGQVFVWDVERATIAERFAGHSRDVDALDMTADGRTLITASIDRRAILWDLAGDRRLDRRFFVGRRFAVDYTPRGIAVSPDGRTLAATHSDGTVDLIDTLTLRRRDVLLALDGAATAVDFSPNGRLLAVTGVGGRATLWNARTLAPAGRLEMAVDSDALAFSPNGKLLAAAEEDVRDPLRQGGPLRVWDVRRRTPTAFRGGSAANSIAFSPDGRLLAAAETERGTEIREVGTGRLLRRLHTGDFARSVAFSPHGGLLFVGQYDGRGYLLSTETWKPVGRPLEGHSAQIMSPRFSPDGRTLVTAAADGTVVLWDVKTQKPIGSPIQLAPDTFASAALSPDGARLFAVSTRGEGISFDMSPQAWKRHACLVAGHELTAAEWHDALPGQPYRAVCSGG
jgi:WD40 repeat protein